LIAKYGNVEGAHVTATFDGPAKDEPCCYIFTVTFADESNGTIDPKTTADNTKDAIETNGAADGLSLEVDDESSPTNSGSVVVTSFLVMVFAMIVVFM